MAKNKKDENNKGGIKIPSRIKKLMTSVQVNLDKLYANTNYSTKDNIKSLDSIKKSIDQSIDSIYDNNMASTGISNLSMLYSRKLYNAQNDKSNVKNVVSLFEDDKLLESMMSAHMSNTNIREIRNEIDAICKYMPKLEEALDVRKDNVLSADHFSKEFLNAINTSNVSNDESFKENMDSLKKKYNLAEELEQLYDDVSKYGEEYFYIVPYKDAFSKLLQNKNNQKLQGSFNANEGAFILEGESYNRQKGTPSIPQYIKDSNINLSITIDTNYMLTETVKNKYNSIILNEQVNGKSLVAINEAEFSGKKIKTDGNFMPDTLDYDEFDKSEKTSYFKDGFINLKDNTSVNVSGAVFKRLKAENVIPVYIENVCLGYYYFDIPKSASLDKGNSALSGNMFGLSGSSANKRLNGDMNNSGEEAIKYMASKLSDLLDAKFINANQDLKNEIYMILKYNDVANASKASKMNITFLPASDVEHCYFEKDQNTNRGISDLTKAMFPSKLYCCLYITNTIAILTRGQDKRVYYVKQNVETNISKTLLNTMDQIKKSNFGIRQIENMNHIANLTGRFNDYVIPTSGSGDYPIQFEVMQGQNVDIKTDLMNILEEMAVNSTDVPLEIIQARQSMDYAVQYSMSNSKFLRKVYKRQAKTEAIFTKIVSKLYNYEYEQNDTIDIILPPPMFLNITNTNQIMDNTNAFVSNIANIEMNTESDEVVKNIFIRLMSKEMIGTYIPSNKIEILKTKAKQLAQLESNSREQ